MSTVRCRIKKDDKVRIIAGKEKGKIGKVLKVIRDKERVIIENVNFVKRHSKPRGQTRQGGIIEKEAPIHWSNVMLMCNKCINPVRIKMQSLEDGRMVRVCRKCGEIIDT
ncbi:MAG: 50S ribosomal protein L24 [Deltaproteobacteria bacterium]|nr:50S ribosomal protein L24 [Deltaproteobacteria bacterium]MBW2074271.1 50S ribosomal protein L24 [Deltaproteobacteria bacterium]RLB81094.1 MAG: 50S ribosomal protein L24 [Deltaproteobacteria bacterium]